MDTRTAECKQYQDNDVFFIAMPLYISTLERFKGIWGWKIHTTFNHYPRTMILKTQAVQSNFQLWLEFLFFSQSNVDLPSQSLNLNSTDYVFHLLKALQKSHQKNKDVNIPAVFVSAGKIQSICWCLWVRFFSQTLTNFLISDTLLTFLLNLWNLALCWIFCHS